MDCPLEGHDLLGLGDVFSLNLNPSKHLLKLFVHSAFNTPFWYYKDLVTLDS